MKRNSTSSKVADFRSIERQLAELLQAQDRIKKSEQFKTDLVFESQLKELIGEYGFSAKRVVSILRSLNPQHDHIY